MPRSFSELPDFPIEPETLAECALESWREVWASRIGGEEHGIRLADWRAPASVIGLLFEGMLARSLARRQPGEWRQGARKGEPDLVYLPRPESSVQLKTSGQGGIRIYGNRSYATPPSTAGAKGAKDGFYLTCNFLDSSLYLLRFGWLNHEDWIPQQSETGQAATLGAEAYRSKLHPIPGAYTLDAPLSVLPGVGPGLVETATRQDVRNIRDLLGYRGRNPNLMGLSVLANKHGTNPSWWAIPAKRDERPSDTQQDLELF